MNNKNPHIYNTKVYKQSGKPRQLYGSYDVHCPTHSSNILGTKEMMLEAELNKYANKIHGIYDGPDDYTSDSSNGKSDFDEEYYKYKPGPIIVDPKKVVVIEKVEKPPKSDTNHPKTKRPKKKQNKKKITKVHQTPTNNEQPTPTDSIIEKNEIFTISKGNHKGSMGNHEKGSQHINDDPVEKHLTRKNIDHGTNKCSTSFNQTHSVHTTQGSISSQPLEGATKQFLNSHVSSFSDSNTSVFNTVIGKEITNTAQFEQKTKEVSQNKVLVYPYTLPPEQKKNSQLSPKKKNTENKLSMEKHAADARSLGTFVDISLNKNFLPTYDNPIASGRNFHFNRNTNDTLSSVPKAETSQPAVSNSAGPSEGRNVRSRITPSSVPKAITSQPAVSNSAGPSEGNNSNPPKVGTLQSAVSNDGGCAEDRHDDSTQLFENTESFWTKFYEWCCCISCNF